jgi:hypothetical protein
MQQRDAIAWFKTTFAAQLQAAVQNTPYSADLLCAIAYQETGYIWSGMINTLSVDEILQLSVGDTLDAPNRSAFPRTKAELIAKPQGQQMFDIARESLVKMAQHVPGYKKVAAMPNKFCHGYGIFQYDLQFFLTNPSFFLEKRWFNVADCFAQCINELKAAQKRQGWEDKTTLTEDEKVFVAIAYNRGKADLKKGFKQGHKPKDDPMFYGEHIFDNLNVARNIRVDGTSAPGAGPATLPPPTPVVAGKKIYRVTVTNNPLNVRTEPRIPKPGERDNRLKSKLPNGHLVNWVSGKATDEWLEIETSLNGAFIKGFAASQFLTLVKDESVTLPPPVVPAITPPTSGIVAVFMPRKAGTITKRTEIANASSLNEPGQPQRPSTGDVPTLRASIKAIIEWLNVEKPAHRRYQPRDGATFCNIYTHDFCHLAGVYFPRVWWTQKAIEKLSQGIAVEPLLGDTIDEIRANNLFRWLRDFGDRFGWRQTGDLSKLQNAANAGGLALIIARRVEEGKSGHVVMVVPESDAVMAKRDATGNVIAPVQSQAGAVNFKAARGKLDWWLDPRFEDHAFWIHA